MQNAARAAALVHLFELVHRDGRYNVMLAYVLPEMQYLPNTST